MKIFNILPPQKKEALRKKRLYKSIIRQEVLVLFLLLVTGVLLGGVWGQLSYQYHQLQAVQARERSIRKDQENAIVLYEQTFVDADKMLAGADILFSKQKRWTWVFLLIDDILPEGISVEKINVQDGELTMEGVASSRESLSSVEQLFQEQECITDANIPLSQLAEKENIAFTMTATLDDHCPKE